MLTLIGVGSRGSTKQPTHASHDKAKLVCGLLEVVGLQQCWSTTSRKCFIDIEELLNLAIIMLQKLLRMTLNIYFNMYTFKNHNTVIIDSEYY